MQRLPNATVFHLFGRCSPSSVFLSAFTPVLWCGKALSPIAIQSQKAESKASKGELVTYFLVEADLLYWNRCFQEEIRRLQCAMSPSKMCVFDGNPKVIIQKCLNTTQTLREIEKLSVKGKRYESNKQGFFFFCYYYFLPPASSSNHLLADILPPSHRVFVCDTFEFTLTFSVLPVHPWPLSEVVLWRSLIAVPS